MLERLISVSAHNPAITLLLVGMLGWFGWLSLSRAPLDALPDLSDVQVIVLTEWPGRSPDLVEDQITYPISSSLLAAPQVKFVRGQSFFGLSFVYVVFTDGTDLYWARSRVVEYLATAKAKLPEDVNPALGPDASGVGWVFQYALVDRTGNLDLADLRSLQDWNVRFALESVPGVAEVASVGGHVKQYQILLDPNRLRAHGVALEDVIRSVRASNQDAGGRVLEIAGHEHMIRGRGYVQSVADLENIVIHSSAAGNPVLLREVAEVAIGNEIRRGVAELDGDGEVVGGIVVMRSGENALEVIDRVKDRVREIEPGLPPGVELVVTYDRSTLIEASLDTLRRTLLEEMLVVSLMILFFLLHVRSALVPIITLPIAVVLAFVPMAFQGISANIMSLGGIAVAIGAMVDASVVLIENVHQRLAEWEEHRSDAPRRQVVIEAMQEVGPSIFFSLLVVTVSFLPVFTLQGTEGRLFRPLAFTKTYSMAFASVLAITLTPALAAVLIRGQIPSPEKHPLYRWMVGGYSVIVRWIVRRRTWVLVIAFGTLSASVPVFLKLGTEFMPPLNEGAILYMPSAPPGMSIGEATRIIQAMDLELKSFPEVERVFGKMGRASTATDPAPIGMAETTILLKPRSQWRPGVTYESLIAEMDEKLRYPGMPNLWWMPIQTRTEMLATGVRSPLAVQIYGDDLASIEAAALQIESVLARVPGTRSAVAERSTGGFFLDVQIDRREAARYGLQVEAIQQVIAGAVGGIEVGETIEGRARYPIQVRYAREFRDTPALLENVLVTTRDHTQIPLGLVASLQFAQDAPMIRSEDGKRVGFVFIDTDRPIAEYVQDASAALRDIDIAHVRIAWVGQYRHLQSAKARLWIVVPITLLLVVILLYLHNRSWIETGIVLLAVPFSMIGSVWLLYLLDFHMSVAVWVGLIALMGLDAETGVIMLLYLKLAYRDRETQGPLNDLALEDAIVSGAAKRIRPKLMTVLTTMLGLVPVLWSQGTGADVMKRIAAPMVGGLASSFALELLVYPALFATWKTMAGRSTSSMPPPHDDHGDHHDAESTR